MWLTPGAGRCVSLSPAVSGRTQAIPLLTGIEEGAVIAGKGWILTFVTDQEAEAVIPAKSNRKDPWEYGLGLYKQRNPIDRAFNKLNQ